MDSYVDPCKKIWEAYQLFASTCAVTRKGYELVGLSAPVTESLDVGKSFRLRGESVLEHQAKTAWLCSVFASNFPSFFGIPDSKCLPTDIWLLIVSSLCHDIGELDHGDIPDDGRPEHAQKDAAEYEAFKRFVKVYGFVHEQKLLTAFRTFQDRDSIEGKALYALDKVEAVLTTIFLEKQGQYGCLTLKEQVTEQDSHFMHETGSVLTTDCWAAHLVTRVRDYPFVVAEPILTLIDVAIQNVRGARFPWWDKELLAWPTA